MRKNQSQTSPRAVIISDIHYNINTLTLADAALRQAVAKANELDVPLIIAGDMHDTKANIRAECVNAIRATLKCLHKMVDLRDEEQSACYILRGNHCSTNERSTEHSLNFLEDLAHIVAKPKFFNELGGHNGRSIYLIPYYTDPNELRTYLKKLDPLSLLIMHQGLSKALPGEYTHDKSALDKEDVSNFRVISGHYHTRQDIKTGRPQKGAVGLWSYVGNPFTLGFAEANDPPKGFQILNSDGLLDFVPTNLRRHIVMDMDVDNCSGIRYDGTEQDLLWVKLRGPSEHLHKLTKDQIARELGIPHSFRLDLIPHDTKATESQENVTDQTQPKLLDSIIDSVSNTSLERKERLKTLWRGLV